MGYNKACNPRENNGKIPVELPTQCAIPKIKMLRNLSCLKARFGLLHNELSVAQKPEPHFKTA